MAKKLNMPTPQAGMTQTKSQNQALKNTLRPDASTAVDLNFKVSPEFKKEFKMLAAEYGISQKEVLERAFALLKRSS